MIDASAPGKLVIVGEYAVLHGAPAIAITVDVRARVNVSRLATEQSVFVDAASGQTFQFNCDDRQGFQWLGKPPGERGRILQSVMETLLTVKPDGGPIPGLMIRMNSDAFYGRAQPEPRKLGLGSSSAILVALAGALFDVLGLPVDSQGITRFCIGAHRRFQGGQGSGIDIAAAVNGGVLGVRIPASGENISVDRLAWPDGLFILPVWSGESASTVDLLSRLYAFRDRNPGAFDRQMQVLSDHAEVAQAAWLGRSAKNIVTAINGYSEALLNLDREAGIGILTDAHERLGKLADRHDARYKTSGAGGGDFGFAYTESAEVADKVRNAFVAEGFSVLNTPSTTSGLTVNRSG